MFKKAVLFLILVIVLVSLTWFRTLKAAEPPHTGAAVTRTEKATQHTDASSRSAALLLPETQGTR